MFVEFLQTYYPDYYPGPPITPVGCVCLLLGTLCFCGMLLSYAVREYRKHPERYKGKRVDIKGMVIPLGIAVVVAVVDNWRPQYYFGDRIVALMGYLFVGMLTLSVFAWLGYLYYTVRLRRLNEIKNRRR